MVVAIVTSSQISQIHKPLLSHSLVVSRPNSLQFFPFSTFSHHTCFSYHHHHHHHMASVHSGLVGGASSTTSDYNSPSTADMLGEVTIFTAAGDSVMFKDLWDQHEGVAVVALLRHFGCFCSWELASALKEAKPRFDTAGVKLIAVGVGTPDKARMLAERLPFPMDCLYADPDHKAYDVLGLYYGFGRTFFNPASFKILSRLGSVKKAMKNFTLAATPDDRSSILQQGGMFVFKGKQLLYARKDNGSGDHAPFDDVFDVCCKVPVA